MTLGVSLPQTENYHQYLGEFGAWYLRSLVVLISYCSLLLALICESTDVAAAIARSRSSTN